MSEIFLNKLFLTSGTGLTNNTKLASGILSSIFSIASSGEFLADSPSSASLFAVGEGILSSIISLCSEKNGGDVSSCSILIFSRVSLLILEILNSEYFSENLETHLSRSFFRKMVFSHVNRNMLLFFIFLLVGCKYNIFIKKSKKISSEFSEEIFFVIPLALQAA